MNQSEFYESDRALGEYLLFHYGRPEELLPWADGPVTALNYPVRCVTECLDLTRLPETARALDLGCAVGRSTFELARHCTTVIGIDFSNQFIAAASHLREQGSLSYRYVEEGRLLTTATAEVPADLRRDRVAFEQGDAQALRPDLGQFDAVLMANLLDRLDDPRLCLAGMPGLIRAGGQLVITTPCTWLEDYTPPSNWLGGFVRDGRPVRTVDALREALDAHFELLQLRDLPFLIREHARKYQWSVAMASTWIRRESEPPGTTRAGRRRFGHEATFPVHRGRRNPGHLRVVPVP